MNEDQESFEAYAIVETIGIRRRREESARMHVHVSIPIHENEELLSVLSDNLGNAFIVSFQALQGRMPSADNDGDGAGKGFTKPVEQSETLFGDDEEAADKALAK